MLPLLKTIHKPDEIYLTAGNPLLVTCNDLEYWICKHSRDSSKLLNELLGSFFASTWDLKTPQISLINVQIEHIPNNIQGLNFKIPSFGSKYINSSKEVDATILPMFEDASFRRKVKNKNDFLFISLFDIWLSNEDRNHNNSNLLIDFSLPNEIYFTVFDHDSIFNSNSLKSGLYQINNFESLINTKLTNILFRKGTNLVNVVDNLVEKFYLCVKKCEENLTGNLELIPTEWGIDIELLENNLRKNLFTQEWIESCENNFRTLIQENIN